MLATSATVHDQRLSPNWARKLLFAALYFSEGAPIGFIWLTIPVRLRVAGVSVEQVTWLASLLIIPWMLKFLWAPLVDTLRSERWTLHHWIYASQTLMAVTLLPLLQLHDVTDLRPLAAALLLHGFAAATQDVAIDALCIAATTPAERGAYNGWMQVGVLLGRAVMGGGVLAMYRWLGDAGAVSMLIGTVLSSMALLRIVKLPSSTHTLKPATLANLAQTYRSAFTVRSTLWGVAFALIAGASFKSFEAVLGLFLVDRGFTEEAIGLFSAGPMILAIVSGSLLGGWCADRVGVFTFVRFAVLGIVGLIAALAWIDLASSSVHPLPLLAMTAAIGVGIGVFTAASYAMYMNLTRPDIAATQFSTFMGAINGCESWSVFVLGLLIAKWGYGPGLLAMCGVSLLALPMLTRMSRLANSKSAQL